MQKLQLSLILIFTCFIGLVHGQKIWEDKVFEENIQSARLFPQTSNFSSQMDSPAIELGSGIALNLRFDDLAYDPDMYSAKIIHCNRDWTTSDLKEPEYLNQFNEFNILDYQYAIDTRIPYIHYNFVLPPVTKTGNYIVMVYRGRDTNQVVMTKRFMVYRKQALVAAKVVPPSQTESRREVQQINVNINYKSRELFDPRLNVQVFIRQNQRWDKVRQLSRPTMVREDLKMLEYQLFDGSNVFPAGNEFRFVDLRFVRARGIQVKAIEMKEDVVYAELLTDRIRNQATYSQYLDLNGQYAIFNSERGNPELESEYIVTTFQISADGLKEAPYLIGSLTQWGRDPVSKMVLDRKTNTYQATLVLKQGWYDYVYAYKTAEGFDSAGLEGNYFETENEYEVFVYYRDMGSRYDELIGYENLNPNKRRF